MDAKTCNSLHWKRQLTQTDRDVSYEWSSYEDYLVDLELLKEHDKGFYNRTHSMNGGMFHNTSWYGTSEGFDGVMRKTLNGWPELRSDMLKLVDGMQLELPSFPSITHTRRRKRRRGDQGDTLDMHRVWSGDLDHAWERPVKVEKVMPNMKRVTVAFDVTANASVDNKMALWRGALCMLLVDSLAKAGRTFEIYVIDSTNSPFVGSYGFGTPQNLWTSWCVKQASAPIVPDRVAAMVSVGYLRTVGFLAEGMGPWEVSGGYGRALNRGLPHSLRDRQANGEVVLRIGECYSKQAVLREYAEAWKRIEQAVDEAA